MMTVFSIQWSIEGMRHATGWEVVGVDDVGDRVKVREGGPYSLVIR